MSSSKKQVQLFLCPTPGAKPEFLATVESIDPVKKPLESSASSKLPERIVLENYTREAWASSPNYSIFQSFIVKSVDGRKKLPGFLKYLKGRQKVAFGRFGNNKQSVLIVHPNQQKANAAAASSSSTFEGGIMEIQFCWDISTMNSAKQQQQQQQQQEQQKAGAAAAAAANNKNKKKKGGGFGLLGNLVASQQRTNAHVVKANAKTKPIDLLKPPPPPSGAGGDGEGGGAPAAAASAAEPEPTKTAQEAIAEFRRIMEEKLLDFDLAPDPVLKIPITLSQHTRGLIPEDLPRVTMEILKYIVYEQAEEINEEWIAHKEPSEFMDEIVVAVYKEGEAPPAVLEEFNQGELPDEMKGVSQAKQQAASQRASSQNSAQQQEITRQALLKAGENNKALNESKRDRRSIEEIQAEQRAIAAKRQKMDP